MKKDEEEQNSGISSGSSEITLGTRGFFSRAAIECGGDAKGSAAGPDTSSAFKAMGTQGNRSVTRFVSFTGLIPIFCQASPSLHMTKVGQGKLMVCCSMLRKGEKVNVETAVSLFNFSAMLSANA